MKQWFHVEHPLGRPQNGATFHVEHCGSGAPTYCIHSKFLAISHRAR